MANIWTSLSATTSTKPPHLVATSSFCMRPLPSPAFRHVWVCSAVILKSCPSQALPHGFCLDFHLFGHGTIFLGIILSKALHLPSRTTIRRCCDATLVSQCHRRSTPSKRDAPALAITLSDSSWGTRLGPANASYLLTGFDLISQDRKLHGYLNAIVQPVSKIMGYSGGGELSLSAASWGMKTTRTLNQIQEGQRWYSSPFLFLLSIHYLSLASSCGGALIMHSKGLLRYFLWIICGKNIARSMPTVLGIHSSRNLQLTLPNTSQSLLYQGWIPGSIRSMGQIPFCLS